MPPLGTARLAQGARCGSGDLKLSLSKHGRAREEPFDRLSTCSYRLASGGFSRRTLPGFAAVPLR